MAQFSPHTWRCSERSSGLGRREKFSPRMWRCPHDGGVEVTQPNVFSAHVEMSRSTAQSAAVSASFLRIRGDVPFGDLRALTQSRFSPRVCGDVPLGLSVIFQRVRVFSTHVEMFLPGSVLSSAMRRFLRIRGGVPYYISVTCYCLWFSPRTWRCLWLDDND